MNKKLLCVEMDFKGQSKRYEFANFQEMSVSIKEIRQGNNFFAFYLEEEPTLRHYIKEISSFPDVPVIVKITKPEEIDFALTGIIPNPFWIFNEEFFKDINSENTWRIHHKIWHELMHRSYFCINMIIKSSMDAIENAVDFIQQFTFGLYPDMKNSRFFEYNLIIRELLTNAVKHGNKFSNEKTVKITAYTNPEKEYYGFCVLDEGEGFCFEEKLGQIQKDDLRVNQRGLFLINQFSKIILSDSNLILTEFKEI